MEKMLTPIDKTVFYEQLLAQLPDVLFKMDWQGRFSYLSPAIEEQSGYTPEEWMALQEYDSPFTKATRSDIQRMLHRIQGDKAKGYLKQLKQSSPIIYADYYHKNGDLIQSEIHYKVEFYNGCPVGIAGVMRNHTKKQLHLERMESSYAAILEEKELLFALIDNIPMFMAMISKEGYYLMANDTYARVANTKRSELIGQHYRNIFPQSLLQDHEPLIEQAFMGKAPSFEQQVEMPNGKRYYVMGRYWPLRNKKGEIIGATIFATDISKRKEAEKRLVQANESKAQLLSIIAHDLRSPLHTLGSLLELAQADALSAEELQECLSELSQNIEDTTDLLDNLLHWAISQMRDQEPQPRLLSVNQLLLEQKRLFKRPLANKKLQLDLQLAEEGEDQVYCDLEMLKVVLRNLISNAIKFSKEEQRIQGRIESTGNTLCISVEDEGVGMSRKSIQRIFEEEGFSTQGTRKERGTGLGLQLCRDYVQKNKGRLVIESEKGKGSCFKIYLPKGR